MSKFRIFWRGEYSEERGSCFGWFHAEGSRPAEYATNKEAENDIAWFRENFPHATYIVMEVDDDA